MLRRWGRFEGWVGLGDLGVGIKFRIAWHDMASLEREHTRSPHCRRWRHDKLPNHCGPANARPWCSPATPAKALVLPLPTLAAATEHATLLSAEPSRPPSHGGQWCHRTHAGTVERRRGLAPITKFGLACFCTGEGCGSPAALSLGLFSPKLGWAAYSQHEKTDTGRTTVV